VKYIFVTGGVVSSLGKGITAASLGTLLEHRGLKVQLQKYDPYLNVDPGTMSPYQHGEVYVLDDGAETDLDLGHYERFTSCTLARQNSLTSGKVYESVLAKERSGEYLGKTVQVIPHVTDEIKAHLRHVAQTQPCDVLITEIGGTTGDIEGLPFIEALRQFALDVGPGNVLFIHLTLIPFLRAAGELKTKPTQQSVAKLREIGIQPHILICRSERPIGHELRQKVSMFCNVTPECVIEQLDAQHSIYEVPLMLQREGLDTIACRLLQLTSPPARMESWKAFVQQVIFPSRTVRVAVVGKYMELRDAYKSIFESLTHAAAATGCGIELINVDAELIEKEGPAALLHRAHGILVPGGFGDRGTEGKIAAAGYARMKGVPYLGLCLGMQIACIEFARNVLGLAQANSTEFDEDSPHPVIALLDSQRNVTRKGGTMRLGACPCRLAPGSRAQAAYGQDLISERHRHRYEFNNAYRESFEKAGLRFSGTSPDGNLVEIIELPGHPWFVACQFHPEFQSKPLNPHPLFKGFLESVLTAAP
jgi:CTP synthase